ncbi:DUF2306 domain-containing protein [Chitinimonas sp. JJ19]|uniref:DUF2306 domain-containing protein n=1 Tax=Chitinimonas sp. JJ19 TaxID=3109352 RepID=UPI003002C294
MTLEASVTVPVEQHLAMGRRADTLSRRVLDWSVRACYGTVLLGQLLFVAYLLLFYVGHALRGQFEVWNKVVPRGYVPGDTLANVMMGMHVMLAAVVIAGGLLQLLPWLRRRLPALHRWNGRVYVVAALAVAGAGLYLIWVQGRAGELALHLGMTLNACLILFFAAQAWREGWRRNIEAHRRWALRLFVVVSGVWFFRVALMFWVMASGGPVGFDPDTGTGPTLDVLAFANYLLPLAVLEAVFFAQSRAGSGGRWVVAGLLVVMSLAMLVGIAVAAMAMWLPWMR